MGPTDRITPAHKQRFATMQELGCLISLVYFNHPGTPGQVHHIISGGRRLGHDATICMKPWYHQGEPPTVRYAGRLIQLTVAQATYRYGPSMAHNPSDFTHRFGTQDELLEMQDALIVAYRRAQEAA